VTKPQGLAGWIRAEILFEEDRAFEPGRKVRLTSRTQERWTEIESFRRQHGRAVLKLRGVEDRSAAEAIVGAEVWMTVDQIPAPAAGSFYSFDLKGCRVSTTTGRYLGVVKGLIDSGGVDLLQVCSAGSEDGNPGELLIPFAEAYLKFVDVAAQRIEVDLPEGLVELNGPWRP